MSLKQERFENFPNGTAFSTASAGTFGETAWSNIAAGSGGSFTTTTADAGHGATCLECSIPSGIAGQYGFVDTAAADGVCAFDFKLLANITAANSQFPVGARYAAAQLGRLEMSATNQLRINFIATTAYGTALSLNTWYRLECQQLGAGTASSSFTYWLYSAPPDPGSLIETFSVTGQNTTALGQLVEWRWGKLNAAATVANWRIDTVRANIGSSTPLGPPPVPAGVNLIGYRSLWSPTAASQASLR